MNSDFRELLSILDRHGVRHLVVGGYAVMVYTKPRYTKTLHLFIDMAEEDIGRFGRALEEFGFPMTEQAVADLQEPNRMISLGRPPVRIDFFNEIDGAEFEEAWGRRLVIDVEGQPVSLISIDDLIASKTAAGRDQDLIDLKSLKKSRG